MCALSIRQPYTELIPRTCGRRGTCGEQIKPIEFRSRPTKRIGERFYIYSSQQWAEGKLLLEGCRLEVQSDECRVQNEDRLRVTSDNLEVPKAGPEPWMLELAKMLILKEQHGSYFGMQKSECRMQNGRGRSGSTFRTGNSQLATSLYEWHLTDVERAKRFRKPKGHPQPVWFTPF